MGAPGCLGSRLRSSQRAAWGNGGSTHPLSCPKGRRLLHLPGVERGREASDPVLPNWVVQRKRLQVLGKRVGRPARGIQAVARGRARCPSACREVGGGQGRVEAAEPVGPWLKTGPTPKCLRIRPASPSQEGALLGWHMLLGFLPRVPRALGRGWQGAEGLIRGSQEGNPQGRHSKKG